MLSFFILTTITLWLLYKMWISVYNYWEFKGFPFVPGVFPFGSSKNLVTLTDYQGFTVQKMYNEMAPHPFFGIYIARHPILVLRDPDVIRLVLAKDFHHFRDRTSYKGLPTNFLDQNLFALEGESWRALRVKLSPTFTSGKLKAMFPLFVNSSKALDSLLLTKTESIVDVKDIACSFTLDTICSCAFGLDINVSGNSNSEFKNLGMNSFKTPLSTKVKLALTNTFPFLTKIIVLSLIPQYMGKFLLDTIVDTVNYRKRSGLKRDDFLDLLIKMREEGIVGVDLKNDFAASVEMSYEMMTAQCFAFFAAGFEASSSIQCNCLFEMAMNPDIQERLYAEISKTIESHGELTYRAVMEMEYLDMVLHETMRKYPTLPILMRFCTKAFTMPSGHRIDEGDKIFIPVYALHHDPAYFPNPDVFDPERFSVQNRESIKPYTYLPFGEGPRICIGKRFGLLQTKMGLITVLRDYRVEKTDSTEVPIAFKGSFLVSTAASPIKLRLCKRKV